MDDNDAAPLAPAGRPDQVSANGSVALGRGVFDGLALDARVGLIDLIGERVIGRQRFKKGGGGSPADGEFGGAIKKLAALDQPMA
ncbi:MAG: hypothetical protein QGF38_02520 [Rhodospirillales bacterium]|nr:hypothetical protein [Rhodospirillales bacterium]